MPLVPSIALRVRHMLAYCENPYVGRGDAVISPDNMELRSVGALKI